MTKGEEYEKRAQAADAHAEKSLGVTRAHFRESAKHWRDKAHEAGYRPVVGKARRSRTSPQGSRSDEIHTVIPAKRSAEPGPRAVRTALGPGSSLRAVRDDEVCS